MLENQVQMVELAISDSVDGFRISGHVTVPEWAQSYNVYQQGLNVDAATAIEITVAPPAPAQATFVPMDENPAETGKGPIASSVLRHRPCTPNERLRAECSVGAAGNDTQCRIVFVFSPHVAVNV